MMNQSIKKIFFALLVFQLVIVGCGSDREKQLYEPMDANTRLLIAMAAKDSTCQTTHVLTLPMIFKVERDDIDNCVFQILELDCAEWSKSGYDNIPITCNLLGVQWK